jgi:hypothetical protein
VRLLVGENSVADTWASGEFSVEGIIIIWNDEISRDHPVSDEIQELVQDDKFESKFDCVCERMNRGFEVEHIHVIENHETEVKCESDGLRGNEK